MMVIPFQSQSSISWHCGTSETWCNGQGDRAICGEIQKEACSKGKAGKS